jgi:restriction system protein
MRGFSSFERRAVNWLGHQPDWVLTAIAVSVFVLISVTPITVVSLLMHRAPFGDSYVNWVMASLVLAALALYLTGAFMSAGIAVTSRRFRLLELHQTMREIQAIPWHEFEDLVAASYEARGYDVDQRGGFQSDGGVDMIVKKGGETWLVQCKHYTWEWIQERPLRELLGVVTAHRASGGIFVTCGGFDDEALTFAKRSPQLQLVGGEMLREMIAQALHANNPAPQCPKCGSNMRRKSGRHGEFFGCVNFPSCHGWRLVEDVPASREPVQLL